jgi:putative addiction module killer protein
MKEIEYYVTDNDKCPYLVWLYSLDKSTSTRVRARIIKLSEGNYGEHRQLDSNISELKFKFGSGYRIYYTEENNTIIILLCAGDKKTQSKDIQKAKEYYSDWKGRQNGR